MKKILLVLVVLNLVVFDACHPQDDEGKTKPFIWRSQPPKDCPFEKSKDIPGVVFTNQHKEYTNADTWYPSWAADGNLYSPWADGRIGDMESNSNAGGESTPGYAKILGDDPMNLEVFALGTYRESALPYPARSPCGSLVYNNVWYYGTYVQGPWDTGQRMTSMKSYEGEYPDELAFMKNGIRLELPWLGPLVGFRISKDYGKTWIDPPYTPENPLFGESGMNGQPVKIGAPHFVDFGKNMEHSPDGKAYLVAHGAVLPDPKARMANCSWITGDQIYIMRVEPSPENMNDPTSYEFFAGHNKKGEPTWTHEFSRIQPLIDWNNRCGSVTMTYNPFMKKYLLVITDGWPMVTTFDTYILESDHLTGPWKLVVFMEKFGKRGCFVNIPSKFISEDGLTAWLCYSSKINDDTPGTYGEIRPTGSSHAMCLREIMLISGNQWLVIDGSLYVDNELYLEDITFEDVWPHKLTPFSPMVWPSKPPADCPLKNSENITGITFTGRHKEYTGADTWYPSWASDGNLYSPWTDGRVGELESNSDAGAESTTGHAKIVGDDPMNLEVIGLGTLRESALPYPARYPTGSLVYNDVWYYGSSVHGPWGARSEPIRTVLDGYKGPIPLEYSFMKKGIRLELPWMGPFVGFRISTDFGRTWEECPRTPENPLFGESGMNGQQVKIGTPNFVDFGRNMEYSPDGKAYLVAHGAVDPDPKPRFANCSIITGDQVYLIRVEPSPENINDPSKYEFFSGFNEKGEPIWSHNFFHIKPLVDWNNRCGNATMTYNPYLNKYLMVITDGWPMVTTFDTYILESDNLTGPWKLVTYMEKFGQQGYFVNIPSKFISEDGLTAWLCYSANYTPYFMGTIITPDPPGSRYALCLQEIKLMD